MKIDSAGGKKKKKCCHVLKKWVCLMQKPKGKKKGGIKKKTGTQKWRHWVERRQRKGEGEREEEQYNFKSGKDTCLDTNSEKGGRKKGKRKPKKN